MEEELTNRELGHKIDDLTSAVGKLDGKVSITNGRVTTLEKGYYVAWGGLIVVNIIGVPILLALLIHFLTTKS